MTRNTFWMKWLQRALLCVALIAGTQQAGAQMTGNISHDMTMLAGALSATISATGRADAAASRLDMEELYRQWRIFRAKNFESQAGDPTFVPRMEKVEAALFAASKRVDDARFAEAHGELLNAQKLLLAAPSPLPDTTKPGSY